MIESGSCGGTGDDAPALSPQTWTEQQAEGVPAPAADSSTHDFDAPAATPLVRTTRGKVRKFTKGTGGSSWSIEIGKCLACAPRFHRSDIIG